MFWGGGKGGKGGGKRGRSTGPRSDKVREPPSSYYFDDYPEAAKGKKVIKCTKSNCFGCILETSEETHCKFCQTEFRRKSRPPSAERTADSGSKAVKAYSDLVAKGMSNDEAVSFLKDIGIEYKQPRRREPNQIISAQNEIEKVKSNIKQSTNNLQQQVDKHRGLIKQLDETEEKIGELEETIKQDNEKIAKLEAKCAMHLGPEKVMTATVSAVPQTAESDVLVVNQMNDLIVKHFDDADDMCFVQEGLMTLLASTHSSIQALTGRLEQLGACSRQ